MNLYKHRKFHENAEIAICYTGEVSRNSVEPALDQPISAESSCERMLKHYGRVHQHRSRLYTLYHYLEPQPT